MRTSPDRAPRDRPAHTLQGRLLTHLLCPRNGRPCAYCLAVSGGLLTPQSAYDILEASSQEGAIRLGARDNRRGLGRHGEDLAARHLAARGYDIIARNWRCEVGEIDLVARDGAGLVFVEVRTRRGRALGSPEESITAAKQARLIDLAEAYVQAEHWDGSWRIDVVAVEMDRRGRLLRVDHYENAITG